MAKRPNETDRAALEARLEKLFAEILRAVREDSGLAARLAELLVPPPPPPPARSAGPDLPVTPLAEPPGEASAPRRAEPQRRGPPPLDPFALYDKGWEQMLREELRRLDVPALREVIFAHDLDPRGRSEQETEAEQLRELIVKAVLERQRI